MKNQALFSSKDKRKKLKCCQLQILFGALWVNRLLSMTIVILKRGGVGGGGYSASL